jgi:hypothetical protein
MTIKLTISKPETVFDGWCGFITLANGKRVQLTKYCGAAPVSFDSREQLIKAAKAVAQKWIGL